MIETIDLCKRFGTEKTFITDVIKNITLSIDKGDFVSIIGPSGSGKSTLLNLLSTLQRPTSGKIIYGDKDITKMNEKEIANFRNRTIGFIFQSHHLFPELTSLENALFPASIAGLDNKYRDNAIRLLERVGLKERLHYKPFQLSGGQCQRVAIARSLLLSPECVFADEPTGNLDVKSTQEVFNLLLELNEEENMTIVMVTHDNSLADKVKRVISLLDGRIVS